MHKRPRARGIYGGVTEPKLSTTPLSWYNDLDAEGGVCNHGKLSRIEIKTKNDRSGCIFVRFLGIVYPLVSRPVLRDI